MLRTAIAPPVWMLQREGCSGATVTRGVAGFGAGSRIKTATLAELSGDLPMGLTVVDTPERIARLLPNSSAILGGGLITVEDVEAHRPASLGWDQKGPQHTAEETVQAQSHIDA